MGTLIYWLAPRDIMASWPRKDSVLTTTNFPPKDLGLEWHWTSRSQLIITVAWGLDTVTNRSHWDLRTELQATDFHSKIQELQSKIKAKKLTSGWNHLPAQANCLVKKSQLDWEFEIKRVELKINISSTDGYGENNDSEHRKGFKLKATLKYQIQEKELSAF